MTALLLLAPQTPLLFQGQEFGSSSPFLYFNDGSADAAELVARGRAKFLSQFPSYALEEVRSRLPRPDDPATFQKCKLDFTEREKHAEIYQLHRDLLCLRRNDPVLNTRNAGRIAAATIGADALLLRWIAKTGDDRLLLVNFGRDLHYEPAPQPLLAPPRNRAWQMLWSSENPTYGGTGTPAVDTPQGWKLPGEAAVLLCSGAKVDD
jgi:maltooligosyltrehalose trehalohydrolase